MSNCATEFQIIRGEQKDLQFTIKNSAGVVIDVSAATFLLEVEDMRTNTTMIQKADGTFDKTQAALGIVKTTLTGTDTDITPNKYLAELRTTFVGGDVDKYQFDLEILYSVIA